MTQPLLILGPSTRAAAFSALRAGLQPQCADVFADRDLQRRCPVMKIAADYPHALARMIHCDTPDPWMYTGGLENWPALIAQWEQARPLWGNGAAALKRARNHVRVAEAIRAAGLPAPVTLATPPLDASRRWLVKPRRGSTGRGILEWKTNSSKTDSTNTYWQEYLDGQPAAAVYAAHSDGVCFLGLTHQFVGVAWLHAGRFQYCGSLGPITPPPGLLRQLTQLGEVLTRACDLRGLFGVDGLLRDGSFWPVEINPRYTASMEVLEYATKVQVLDWQRRSFQGEPTFAPLPRYSGGEGLGVRGRVMFQPLTPNPSPLSTGERGEDVPHAQSDIVGKAILFAPRATIFPQDGPWLTALDAALPIEEMPAFADIPFPGTAISQGEPILSFFVRNATLSLVQDALRQIADSLGRLLFPSMVR